MTAVSKRPCLRQQLLCIPSLPSPKLRMSLFTTVSELATLTLAPPKRRGFGAKRPAFLRTEESAALSLRYLGVATNPYPRALWKFPSQ
jgi:hypothetical protein